MLCKRIVFTEDVCGGSDRILDFARQSGIHHSVLKSDDALEMETDADDEELYSICCELSKYVSENHIKAQIMSFLHRSYNCFNEDEHRLICTKVTEREFISELSGRMYVYLKVNGTINPHGFYTFMCRDISARVLTEAEVEAENIIAMNDNNDFIELLKYFSSVSPDSADRVELSCDRGGIRITSCQSANSDTEYALEDADVLAELVTLNPKSIEITGKEDFLKNDLYAVITAVFKDRIEYK